MLKRLAYTAVLTGVSLLAMGCDWGGGGWWPYNGDATSVSRIVTAILREDIFG